MVVSFLTIYVIAFSSVILLGKSYITTTASAPALVDVTGRPSHRRGIKLYSHNHVRNKGAMDAAEGSKTYQKLSETHFEGVKVLQSSFVPSNLVNVRKLSNDSIRHVKANHSYFALFDPTNNVTNKLEVSGLNLPSEIRSRDFYDLAESKLNSIKHFRNKSEKKIKNFIEWDVLQDYERETRIHYNGITAKETIVKTGLDEGSGKSQGLKLRQLTDGTHFIQLIYTFDDEIQDCEYIKQKSVVKKFLKSFRDNVENAKIIYNSSGNNEDVKFEKEIDVDDKDPDCLEDEGKIEKYSLDQDLEQYEGEDLDFGKEYRNVTFQIIRSDEYLPKEFAKWMNYSSLKQKCQENHRILKQLALDKKHGNELAKKMAEEHIERVKRNLDFSLIFPGTKWCGKSHIAEKYTSLGGFTKTDKCCRAHDYCHPLIPAFEEKYSFYNFRPFTISHCRCDLRRKRDIMDVLLVPGTKWCGKGRRATKYTSLGGFSRTDKCCRVHDTMCPHWIGSLEEKYGLFNWRINTIMHCRCDKRFRACLKMARTGTANFVGKLFFNVVQTKCFVLKPQEVCLKYSWWGKCEKKEYRKKAYLKDNLSY